MNSTTPIPPPAAVATELHAAVDRVRLLRRQLRVSITAQQLAIRAANPAPSPQATGKAVSR